MTTFSPYHAVDDLDRVLKSVQIDEVEAFERVILSSKRVFVTGLGRTGLMARGFAMRLMHLGRRVYHVGDVITPAIAEGDGLVICSRTGRSQVLRHYINIAHRAGARAVVVTADSDSPVARAADVVLCVNDAPVLLAHRDDDSRGHPLGSLFEQALLVVLDQIVISLMDALELSEHDLARIHTTFE